MLMSVNLSMSLSLPMRSISVSPRAHGCHSWDGGGAWIMRKEIGEIAREKGTDLGEITTISSMPS